MYDRKGSSIECFLCKIFYFRVVNYRLYCFSMWYSAFTDGVFSAPLCNLFKYSATCRRKPAEWGQIVVLELHVSFVTVTANLPGAKYWERERAGRRAQSDHLNLSQSSARGLPLLPLPRERQRGCRSACSVHLHASF